MIGYVNMNLYITPNVIPPSQNESFIAPDLLLLRETLHQIVCVFIQQSLDFRCWLKLPSVFWGYVPREECNNWFLIIL